MGIETKEPSTCIERIITKEGLKLGPGTAEAFEVCLENEVCSSTLSTDSSNRLQKLTDSIFIDGLAFIKSAIEAIIEDDVTIRFSSETFDEWNFLARTKTFHRNIPIKLEVVWFIGLLFRYTILLPIRIVMFLVWVSCGDLYHPR
jgi:hypothetical protein